MPSDIQILLVYADNPVPIKWKKYTQNLVYVIKSNSYCVIDFRLFRPHHKINISNKSQFGSAEYNYEDSMLLL